MKMQVKICGVRTPAALAAAHAGHARFIGFNFYPPSPRFISPMLARELSWQVPTGLRVVGLFVNPADDLLDEIKSLVSLDMIQLHGEEPPSRVAALRARTGLKVIKAVPVRTREDVLGAAAYDQAADWLLFDTKPPVGVTALPGGTGQRFDWSLLQDFRSPLPWLLAGGLAADNLAEARQHTGAMAFDVASGVEDRPGHQDPLKIKEFLAVAASL